jgi:hypothetical protein
MPNVVEIIVPGSAGRYVVQRCQTDILAHVNLTEEPDGMAHLSWKNQNNVPGSISGVPKKVARQMMEDMLTGQAAIWKWDPSSGNWSRRP